MIVSDFLSYFDEKNPYQIFNFEEVPVLPAVYSALMENIKYSKQEVELLTDFFTYCDNVRFKNGYNTIDAKTLDKYINKANKYYNNIIKDAYCLVSQYYTKYGENKIKAIEFIFDAYDFWLDYIKPESKLSKMLSSFFNFIDFANNDFNKYKVEINKLKHDLIEKDKIIHYQNILCESYIFQLQCHGVEIIDNIFDCEFDNIKLILNETMQGKTREEIAKQLRDKNISMPTIGALLFNSKVDKNKDCTPHRDIEVARKLLGRGRKSPK